MDENVDFKELYLEMMRASEEAIRVLIKALQACEEKYLSMQEISHQSSKVIHICDNC